jgi:NAD(P)-dependent dehydrogenase (short-subunit alcohol dehydrogenase family)
MSSTPNALVTGASRGIGWAIAQRLASEGYRVYAGMRQPRPSVGELRGDLRPLELDITDASSIAAAVESVGRESGGLDVLVNNAGYGLLGAVEELPLEALRSQFDTNVFGAMALTQAVLPGMREKGSGAVVNISSLAGLVSVPFMGAYCASKFALEALTAALRMEVRRFGIRVFLVEPGPIVTDFAEAALAASRSILENQASPYRQDNMGLLREYEAPYSHGIPGPEVVAEAVLRGLRSRHPRLRYRVRPREAFIARLVKVLPEGALERGLQRRHIQSMAPPPKG